MKPSVVDRSSVLVGNSKGSNNKQCAHVACFIIRFVVRHGEGVLMSFVDNFSLKKLEKWEKLFGEYKRFGIVYQITYLIT